MKIHYALYDPQPQRDSYWTWFSPAISEELCDAVFSAYLSDHLSTPQSRVNLGSKDVFGGIIRLHEKWTVVYRLLPTHRTGASGRYDFVIITAWIETAETRGVDLSPILTSPVFQNTASKASKHPVPKPESLTETIDAVRVKTPTLSHEMGVREFKSNTSETIALGRSNKEVPLPQDISKSFSGDKCAIDAAAMLADVPIHRIVLIPLQPLVWVKIEKTADREWASVEIMPNAHPITIVPKPPKPAPPRQEPFKQTSGVSSGESEYPYYDSDRDYMFELWQWAKESLCTLGGICYTLLWVLLSLILLFYGYVYGSSQNKTPMPKPQNISITTPLQEKKEPSGASRGRGEQNGTPGSPPTKNLVPLNQANNKVQTVVSAFPMNVGCVHCHTWTDISRHRLVRSGLPFTDGNNNRYPFMLNTLKFQCPNKNCNKTMIIPALEFHVTVTEFPE